MMDVLVVIKNGVPIRVEWREEKVDVAAGESFVVVPLCDELTLFLGDDWDAYEEIEFDDWDDDPSSVPPGQLTRKYYEDGTVRAWRFWDGAWIEVDEDTDSEQPLPDVVPPNLIFPKGSKISVLEADAATYERLAHLD